MGPFWNACGSMVRACKRRGGLLVIAGLLLVVIFVPLKFWLALLGAVLIALGVFLWIAS